MSSCDLGAGRFPALSRGDRARPAPTDAFSPGDWLRSNAAPADGTRTTPRPARPGVMTPDSYNGARGTALATDHGNGTTDIDITLPP